MKKLLSVLLSAVMIFSAVVPFSALAETKTIGLKEVVAAQVEAKADMLGAMNYLKASTPQTVANSYEVHKFAQAGGDVSEYLTALESNLKANNGKIMARQQGETADSENLVYYAVAIDVLTILGKDVTNFGGYNVKQAFETFAQTNKNVSNPYFYRCIVEACKAIGNDDLAKTLIDQMSKSYTVGSGYDYWGVSCDNTAMYASSIASYKAQYQANFNDAVNVVSKYKKAKGYYSDDKYTTSENADSTAYAMMAYSVAGEFDKAYEAYQLLKNFESKNNGVFMAADWKTGILGENKLATADALRALSYFDKACDQKIKDLSNSDSTKPTEPKPAPTTKPETAKPQSTKPAKTKVQKISTGKKSITAQWKKVAGVSAYQVQIATNKKFSKNKKTFKVSKKSTKVKIKKLKAKKVYYVRVRSYKKVNGKKVYSKWSTVRKVKTK
ncbi:fibronectin type III domain-containing protein [uncultured Eubacterium sp.]|uniref:fibronectin type III domain-containing protein n=1 Tax=uncultured Eubacterium sp. TaxID=165185 RepID=UPI0025D173D1|nr:fibronectin type III domain-containing protein [uncultured Eubacterium sp.]